MSRSGPVSGLGLGRLGRIGGSLGGGALALVPFGVAVLLLVVLGQGSIDDKITVTAVAVIYAVGLQAFSGSTGILSFAPLVFGAAGGYVGAIVSMTASGKARLPGLPEWLAVLPGQPLWVCLAAGALAGLALGAVTVVIPLRLEATAATVVTLALLLVANSVLVGWAPVTRGAGGLSPVPQLVSAPVAVVAAVLVVVGVRLFRVSRTGLQLRASKSDRLAAETSGVPVRRLRGRAWLVSAAVGGLGGAVLALHLGSVTPQTFYLAATLMVIAALIVGGQGSVSGAVTGAALVSLAQLLLRPLEQLPIDLGPLQLDQLSGVTQLAIVALLLAAMYLRPQGIVGGREFDELLRARRRAASVTGGNTAGSDGGAPGAEG